MAMATPFINLSFSSFSAIATTTTAAPKLRPSSSSSRRTLKCPTAVFFPRIASRPPLQWASAVIRCSATPPPPPPPPKGPTTTPPPHPEYIPNRIPDPNYIRIFDTTLRDGEQSPGAAMTSKEKLNIARQLAKLNVDIIEAGFPAASSDDFVAVKAIALEVGNAVDPHGYVPVICGLSRCNEKDIQAAWDAVRFARRPRIHTFIATSEIHMHYKLKKSKQEVIDIARRMVAFAWSLGCDDVEFSPEDAGRSERDFLYEILGEVIKAGATTLNIPDTVGITMPEEFGKLIADIKANTPGIENVIISTHCHNDLGLSTANTIAGACAGARQVEVTINGIGERAGNASLEEVVMALKCKGGSILGGLYTGINTRHIIMTSKMVEGYSGLHVQPHKAIVGANAFVHESGIHQDGMLKHKGTYEIISPDDIGHERTNEAGIVLGKLSGRHALKMKLAEVTCGTLALWTATVKLISADGKEYIACAVGTGPVDSAYKAVFLIVKVPATLLEYSMTAVTDGIDAIATTQVLIRDENNHTSTLALTGETIHQTFSGTGSSMDIAVSSVRAYIGALNKMLGFMELTPSM
ncbi:hypothetical protein ACJRO7_000036 [Eucalyptus globulus]|uniref:2-isopropylmalate synthase n=1 Tax=Eucalyptus globulus TaxID=34317 RepID=A0ABD3LPT7_EUCGL